MEDKEQKFIIKNLYALIHVTTCNPALLAIFREENVLCAQDCQELEAMGRNKGAIAQASQLYTLILTRRGSYDVLLRALQRPDQNQPTALNILSQGKDQDFDVTLQFDYQNDLIVHTIVQYTSPPSRLKDLFYNRRLPVLVITTGDITVTTQRLHAERIPTEDHLFFSETQLKENFERTLATNVFLVAMHGKRKTALEVVLRILRELGSRVNDKKQCIVITTESTETVQQVLELLGINATYCDVIEDDLKWNQLSQDFQTRLLARVVKFQGQEKKLEDLLYCCETEEERRGVLEQLETHLLLQLINDERPVFCKNTLEARPTPQFYIERKVTSRQEEVSSDILLKDESPADTAFVISGRMRHDLAQFRAGEICTAEAIIRGRTRNLSNAKFILLKSGGKLQEQKRDFIALCRKIGDPSTSTSPVKNLHWLNYSSAKGAFEWVQSYGQPGVMSLVQKHVISTLERRRKYAISEQQLIRNLVTNNDLSNPPAICISDNPGMGKTTLMGHIGDQLQQSVDPLAAGPRFIQYFVMTELMRDLENQGIREERKLTRAVIIKTLLNKMTESSVVRYMFRKPSAHCELMLDGFDEVLPHQAKLAVKFISILRHEPSSGADDGEVGPTLRIWLTTRPILLPVVEQTLAVLGYNMMPFDVEDQKAFLKLYWTREADKRKIQLNLKKLEQFIDGSMKLMERVSGKLSKFETEMTGLPLQCLLLGQICEGSVNFECSEEGERGFHYWEEQDPEQLSIKNAADLYGRALDKKLEICLHRESSSSHLESHLSQNNKQIMKRIHMKLALELLFPEWVQQFEIVFLHEADISPEELSIYGFVTEYTPNNPAVFVHRTYAEYFVALFAVEIGTNQRLLEGFRITVPMSQFLLDGVLATTTTEETSHWLVGEDLPNFQMSVVTYFIDELLENKMAEEPVPRPLLDAVRDNFVETWDSTAGSFDMKTSKLLASIICDRPQLCNKVLLASLNNERRQQWIRNSKEHLTKMVYVTALMANKEGLQTLCGLLNSSDGNDDSHPVVTELPYQLAKNPLLAAALTGKVESVEYLVQQEGFRPEVWADPEMQILHHVVRSTTGENERTIENRRNIIYFLVDNQHPRTSDNDSSDNNGHQEGESILEHIDFLDRTPLLAENVHIRLRITLIEAGANVHALNQDGNQVLHMLGGFEGITPESYQELVEIIEKSVLESCTNPDEHGYIFQNANGINVSGHMYTPNWDWHGDTALHLAVGHLEVTDRTLEIFKKYGFFKYNRQNSHDCTIVHIAVKLGRSLALIKKLVEEYEVDWTIRDLAGMTAFHVAASVGHFEFLNWICAEYDFDIDDKDYNARTALHYAMLATDEKRLETVMILLDNGESPNAINQEEDTPLTWSLYQGRGISVPLLEYLKAKGANILGLTEEEDNNDRKTVIDAVYFKGDDKLDKLYNLGAVVEYLVGEGADLEDGRTLGHKAAGNGWLKGLQLLDKYLGRDKFIVMTMCMDEAGYTVIGKAIREATKHDNSARVVEWLISVIGTNLVLNQMCEKGEKKPIHVCAEAGWLEGMELLVETYHVDTMARDEEGNTALHWAYCTDGMLQDMVGYLEQQTGLNRNDKLLLNEKGESPEEFGKRKAEEVGDELSWAWE